MKEITFIIPTCGRRELLEKCLLSLDSALTGLRPQDLSDFKFNVRIIFNGEPVRAFTGNHNLHCELISVERMKPSEARNLAIKQQPSDYFYFIDDDTELPKDFLTKVCEIIRQNQDVAIFGGPDNCLPNVSVLESSLQMALRSPLTTQKTNKRHTPSDSMDPEEGTERNLILCNLCVHGGVFTKYDCYFPSTYQRNEENVFLSRLVGKVKVRYFSHLFIYHNRRYAIKNVYQAASCSGFYRMKMIFDGHGKHQWIFFAPALFFIYLIAIPFILFFNFNSIFLIPLFIYLILNLCTSAIGCVREKRPHCFPFVCCYQMIIILSYAAGSARALASYFKDKYSDRISNLVK